MMSLVSTMRIAEDSFIVGVIVSAYYLAYVIGPSLPHSGPQKRPQTVHICMFGSHCPRKLPHTFIRLERQWRRLELMEW
jgi:hypothetical protein